MSVLLKKRNIKNEFQIQKTLDKNKLDPDIQHLVAPEGHNNMDCRDSGMNTLQFHSLDWVTSPEEGLREDIWGIFDVLGHSDAAHRFVQSPVSTQVCGDWKNQTVAKTLQDWLWVIIYQELPVGLQRVPSEYVSTFVLVRAWPAMPYGGPAIITLKRLLQWVIACYHVSMAGHRL